MNKQDQPTPTPARITIATGSALRTVTITPEMQELIDTMMPHCWLTGSSDHYTEAELSAPGLTAARAAMAVLGFVAHCERPHSKPITPDEPITPEERAAFVQKYQPHLDRFFDGLDMTMKFASVEDYAQQLAEMLHSQAMWFEPLRKAGAVLKAKGVDPESAYIVKNANVYSTGPRTTPMSDEFDYARWLKLFVEGYPLSMARASAIYWVLRFNGYLPSEIATAVGNALVESMTA